jgi:hypothetical protein
LGGIVDQRIAPSMPEKGQVHTALPLFRHAGEATVKVELWKDTDGSYDMQVNVEWIDGGSNAFSLSGAGAYCFPSELRLYWTEPDDAAAAVTNPAWPMALVQHEESSIPGRLASRSQGR